MRQITIRNILAALICLAAAALACSAPDAETPTPGITEIFPLPDTAVPDGVSGGAPSGAVSGDESGAASDLTIEQLRNLTYPMPDIPGGSATLSNGTFIVPNPELGGNTNVIFQEPFVFGDIDGDGVSDAVVRLIVHTDSTTGQFSVLVPVLNQSGTPQPSEPLYLGDRVILNGITIEGGLITADMIVAGPNDGACCPNTPALRTFRFEDGQLVEYVSGMTATPYVAPLTYDMFLNLTYHDVQQPGETFTMENGTFTGDTGSGPVRVTLTNNVTFGDLDGDGAQDAVVVLSANTEGTGVFYYLVAIRNNNGVAEHAATAFIGDRIAIDYLEITDGVITINMKIAGPNDGACCPNTPAIKKFKLQGTQLVQVS